MDLKTFLENFDAIAEAPGGIPKLRTLILDMAVRGKLVAQNPEDEPGDQLFKKIQESREVLYSKKKATAFFRLMRYRWYDFEVQFYMN